MKETGEKRGQGEESAILMELIERRGFALGHCALAI